MKILTFTAFALLLLFSSCDSADSGNKTGNKGNDIHVVRKYFSTNELKAEITVKGNVRHGLTKNYSKRGKLLSTVNYLNGKKEGKTTNYYPSGKVHSTMIYRNNLKNGDAVWYYENGKPYTVNPFINNKLNGIQKKYYKNGKILAEIPYKEDQPGTGLKEYTGEGKLITKYPRIIIEEINRVESENKFIIRIYLSNRSSNVKFYIDELYDGRYLKEYMYEIQTRQGMATRTYEVPPGYVKFQKMSIIAKVNTHLGNPYIIQRTYNLAIQH